MKQELRFGTGALGPAMLSDRMKGLPMSKPEREAEVPAPAPTWATAPASIKPLASFEEFTTRADAYFADMHDREERPTVTGFCLAVGVPGPTSLLRLGQRVPEFRAQLSRCLTALAYGYEKEIGTGNASGAVFMLKNIPDFDPEDPDGAPAVLFFEERKEIVLSTEIAGGAQAGEDFKGDALEAYLSIIKRQTPRDLKSGKTQRLSGQAPRAERMLRILNPEVIDGEAVMVDGDD